MIRNKNGKKSGFTLLEMMIAIALFGVVFALFFQIMMGIQNYILHFQGYVFLDKKGSDIIYVVREDLLQSKKIYERGSDWDPLNGLNINMTPALVPGYHRLPDIAGAADDEELAVDTSYASGKTGNVIFFLKRDVVAKCDLNSADDAIDYHVDLYRFVCYYTNMISNDRTFRPSTYRRDLIRWESKLYADYIQITSIDDLADRIKVLELLLADGVTHLLRPGENDPANAFFPINTSKTDGFDNADSSYQIQQAQSGHPVYFPSKVSLGINTVTTNPRAWKYSNLDTAPTDFPGGFEVQVVGLATHNVLIRLHLMKLIPTGYVIPKVHEIIVKTNVY